MKHINISIRQLVKATRSGNLSAVQKALSSPSLMKDEDIFVIALREMVRAGMLEPGGKITITIGNTILEHEPSRSILARFARKLNDTSSMGQYLQWMDAVLAKNVHMEVEEWAKQWDQLNDVIEIRRIIAQSAYDDPIDERCKPISPTIPTPNNGDKIVPEEIDDFI